MTKFNIFTDGSCLNNGKKNPIGAIGIYFGENGENNDNNISQVVSNENITITNQTMELYACIEALRIIINKPEPKIIYIYSDSTYTCNCMTKWYTMWTKNGWKNSKNNEIANKELIIQLHDMCNKTTVIFKHVYAHQVEPTNKDSEQYKIWYGNNMADKLAQTASKQYMKNLKKKELENIMKDIDCNDNN